MEGKMGRARAFMLFLVVVTAVGMWDARMARALTAAQCKQERNILVSACTPVLKMKPASPFCCERLRVTHIDCVCPIITPQLAALINVNYAIKVIQGCGRPVPRHFKCGSITTP
ncbi:hypothetical protein HHK36_028130 [Tetracentron sinense]|uniref:Bifunctional inhibitor/plant lipid transfer protein/seed storage helical domain-containing protein n=1 Tax=Tetracentron sinense TaxID=13715 RepID=A0A834YKH4_TETSI|nr:hypothetical protein HHK36_028130 [Tetracentron sinense]